MTAPDTTSEEQPHLHVAILGAGGVGGYYGGVLARAGHDVTLLARGAHLDAVRARGLELREPEGTAVVPVAATDDPAALGAADLAIVAVKSYALEEIAPAVAHVARRGATVLPLLNGVDAADRLAAAGVPRDALLGGVTFISAARVAAGVIERWSPFRRVVLGELAPAQTGSTARTAAIAAALRSAGVTATVTDEIVVELWRKLAFLAPIAAACGLARAPIGAVRDAPLGREVLARAVEEIVAVARALGVPLGDDEARRTVRAIDDIPPAMRPSLLLDLERGGPTEIDVLSGAIARLGRERGIPTPTHDVAVAALSAAVAQRLA